MKIFTKCPFCNSSVELSEDAIDRRVRCLSCRLLFKIPHKDDLKAAFEKMRETKSSVYIDSKGNTYA